ncbi:MDIS1-interacting receptor like kinase 1-like [Triticum dicoccoides]|uniref:MDIS1-interacting receptor like kinase 1-like n=1 Tax=Triticum dicoccoides TaxID=85692 RepID=UPI0018910522|nr:MDIS1-interacting receptor like kinase 1-like [Triticum dicoccoides]
MSSLFWSRPGATQPILLNEQAIVDNLCEDNVKTIWSSRRTWKDEQQYLVHGQGVAGITHPCPLVVKKFEKMNSTPQVDENFMYRYRSEMIMLASNPHDNIIKVIELIEREDAIMLVYEYPVNGSLKSWLHQPMDAREPLCWPQRRLIAIGTANGLRHLQHGCNKPIIHHNISSDNILLDQNRKAVITNFDDAWMNMAGLGQPLPIMGVLPGNFWYAAPEYGNTASQMTEKVDTYSFGVILLELVTGRLANEAGGDGNLAIWAHKFTELMGKQLVNFESAVDKRIPDQARYMDDMAIVFRLGVDCTVVDPQQRPSMHMALKRLRRGHGCGPFRGLLTRL